MRSRFEVLSKYNKVDLWRIVAESNGYLQDVSRVLKVDYETLAETGYKHPDLTS